MGSAIGLVAFVARAENRVAVLLGLMSGPKTRPDLQTETGIPRATLSRILADFRERNLVARDGHEYDTTPLGDLLAGELQSLFDSIAVMETLQTVQQWLSIAEDDIPLERLAEAEVIVPKPSDPLAPIRRAEELLADASRVRMMAQGVIPGCLDAIWRAVTDGRQTLEGVTTQGALETLAGDARMRRQAQDIFAAKNATGYVHPKDTLPMIFIVDELVWIAVADDAGAIQGHIETTDGTVRAWAEETIDAYKSDARPLSKEVLTA